MTIYLQKEVKSMQEQPSYIKRVQQSKSQGQKSEIKGGGHEMAAIMLIIINFINAQSHFKIYYHPHHCSHFMATTFDLTTFSP